MVLSVFCRLWRAVIGCPSRSKRDDDSTSAEAGLETVEIKDDLTVIRGIGEATQDRLYAAGITSYAALAESTPEEVLRALGSSRPRLNVEQWIRRAGELSAARQP